MKPTNIRFLVITAYLFIGTICAYSGEDWLQFKYDCRNSGNVPERKLPKANNMKFHDQRFKQWTHKRDSSYLNNFRNSDSSRMYSGSALPFMNNFGYPGSRYGNPLITPGLYRGGFINPASYGMNPYAFNPNSGLSNRPWNW